MAENTTHGRTKAGVELSKDVLDEHAEQAEAGPEVTNLRRRPGRPSMGSGSADSFPVRLDPELRRAVGERAAAEHKTGSDVVREATAPLPPSRLIEQSPTDDHPITPGTTQTLTCT